MRVFQNLPQEEIRQMQFVFTQKDTPYRFVNMVHLRLLASCSEEDFH